ncbi:MAG TPA: glycerol-3-phosphate 1-O-acyltransferase PlsY [Anaerolineae bacterium]|nr:glycerol-3-phosphate 1-O-acyltransferase PlsY [Anaerolineae bacterium]
MITQILITLLIGYLFGCIQTAYILGKLVRHTDIRQEGSGNAGASNVITVLGLKYGLLTGAVDILKGLLPVVIVRALYPATPALAYAAGMVAIAGHIFPFYLGFRGGKGVATLMGMLLAYDLRLGALFVVVMAALAFGVDYVAVGSVTVFTMLPIATYLLSLPLACQIAALALAVIAWIKHAENLQRIRNGTELHVRAAFKKK